MPFINMVLNFQDDCLNSFTFMQDLMARIMILTLAADPENLVQRDTRFTTMVLHIKI